jgi:hypothetical protein
MRRANPSSSFEFVPKIILFIEDGQWMARFQGPHAQRTLQLFSTDTLPTAYSADVPPPTVQAELRERNPGCSVEIERGQLPRLVRSPRNCAKLPRK